MRETKIHCDHCGKELDTMRDFDDLTIEMNHKWLLTDLCAECLDKLYASVREFCKKGGE